MTDPVDNAQRMVHFTTDRPNFERLRGIAKSAPGFPWAMSNPWEDQWGHVMHSIGPEYDPEEYPDGYDFVEDTLMEIMGHDYPSEAIARFVATFDPPMVLALLERAALRDGVYEAIGVINGENVYRRL